MHTDTHDVKENVYVVKDCTEIGRCTFYVDFIMLG
jgi:hypothetical protein